MTTESCMSSPHRLALPCVRPGLPLSAMTDPATVHVPVLLNEILDLLNLQPGQTVVDGTLGGGGHSRKLSERVGDAGRVIGIDRDPSAIEAISPHLPDNVVPIVGNYADLPEILDSMEVPQVDAILLDLGFSSDQLASPTRGFSFNSEGDLDLRFDPLRGEPAYRLVNRLKEKHLADLIYEFGEEKFSRRIARKICARRHEQPIRTARQLADLVRSCVPRSRNHSIDPATRTFQALRIAVNEELKWLTVAVRRIPGCLAPGGRIAIISFHSLEDRIVKTGLKENPQLDLVNRRPITASDAEIAHNPRSRSAKLRVAQRRV